MWVIENCQFLINPFHHAGLLGNNEIKRLVSFIALLLFASPGLTQTVVLDAKPTVKVESNKDTTKRDLLSKTDQEKYRVRIIKDGTRYLWASRENRELVHQLSGAFHLFVDSRGGGYVKVFDNTHLPESMREAGGRFQYIEHLPFWLGTPTYWGTFDKFDP